MSKLLETATNTSPEFAIHFQPHGAILLDRKSMFYFRLSGRGTELALMLAKNNSVQKTARIWEILSKEKVSEEELNNELDSHPFTSAWKKGLLNHPLMITGSTEYYLPISCTLQLTNMCNLKCPFCYASSGKPYPDELSSSQWIKVLQKLASHGVADITITGGEAKLTKNFLKIIATASSLFTNVNLFSNGLNWRDDEIELISYLGNVSVQISIDGNSSTHDKLRGREGGFSESLKNAERFAQSSVPVLIAMTVNQLNYKEVYEVIEKSVDVGAVVFRAGQTIPVGRASEYQDMTSEMKEKVKQQLADAKKRWSDQIIIIDWEDHHQNDSITDFCTPGFLSWYIRADGQVTPCQIEDTSLGHVLKNSMQEIGSPERLMQAKRLAKQCRCIGKIELPEADLPFTIQKEAEVKP
ncbi:MAG: sporulation killing factor system radical SAM maturase [Bacillaceae bacterium]|nr:MAG: sporulation killing factor system radical SAM maturase [Bacillaceae bacterium]